MAVQSLHQILAELKLRYLAVKVRATVLPYTVYVRCDEQSRARIEGSRRAAIDLFISNLGKPPEKVLAMELVNNLPTNAWAVHGGWLSHGHDRAALKPVNWNKINARCGGIPKAFDPDDDIDIASWLKSRQVVFPSLLPESPTKT